MQKIHMHGTRLIGAVLTALFLAACSSTPVDPAEVTSFDTEPISIAGIDEMTKTSKRQVIASNEATAISRTKNECDFNRPSGYYDQLEALLIKQLKTVYTIETADAAYDVTVLPNTAGYVTMNQFKEDFVGCNTSGVWPLRLTSDWLVFASPCTPGDDACGRLKAMVDPEVKLK